MKGFLRGISETWSSVTKAIAIAGVITYVWIGINTYVDYFAKTTQPTFGGLLRISVPYVAFVVAAIFFIIQQQKIQVRHHRILSVWAVGSSPPCEVSLVPGQSQVELRSSKRHFEIGLRGAFTGPEVARIRKRFGDREIRVYATVCEHDRPASNDLRWLQSNECGLLDAWGHYEVRAYLGGALEQDCAADGELFQVAVYLPAAADDEAAGPHPTYVDDDAAAKAIFVSEPLYVRARRQAVQT